MITFHFITKSYEACNELGTLCSSPTGSTNCHLVTSISRSMISIFLCLICSHPQYLPTMLDIATFYLFFLVLSFLQTFELLRPSNWQLSVGY